MRSNWTCAAILAAALAMPGCCSTFCPPGVPAGKTGQQISEGEWEIGRTADGLVVAYASVITTGVGMCDEWFLVRGNVTFPFANPGEYKFTGLGSTPRTKAELCSMRSASLTEVNANNETIHPKLYKHAIIATNEECP